MLDQLFKTILIHTFWTSQKWNKILYKKYYRSKKSNKFVTVLVFRSKSVSLSLVLKEGNETRRQTHKTETSDWIWFMITFWGCVCANKHEITPYVIGWEKFMSVSILVVIYSIFGWMCLSENHLKHEHACAPAHTDKYYFWTII